jgi:SAM-dependent methyltransferase
MMSLLRALPGRVARRLKADLERRVLGPRGFQSLPIGRAHAGGVLDSVEVADDGTVAVVGWSADESRFIGGLELVADGVRVAPTHVFRVTRGDLAKLGGRHSERLGLVAEFVLSPDLSGRTITLMLGEAPLVSIDLPSFTPPEYSQFFGNPGVWHREDVYGVGPPEARVSREILDLCSDLEGPLLDFGCGAGALVSRLRAQRTDAHGLELDTPTMRSSTLAGATGHVTFYDGAMPAPFASGAFASVTCCEVLEHIPDYEGAVAELARLARDRVVITVPDMSAIPRGRRHGVVPWHLLEASHVNFFTQQSLGALLQEHFREVRFLRIGEVRCDRMRFYTSLVAFCER